MAIFSKPQFELRCKVKNLELSNLNDEDLATLKLVLPSEIVSQIEVRKSATADWQKLSEIKTGPTPIIIENSNMTAAPAGKK